MEPTLAEPEETEDVLEDDEPLETADDEPEIDRDDGDEPEVLEVDLTDDDFDGGGLFTGVEDADEDGKDEAEDEEPGEDVATGEKADKALGLADDGSEIEDAINTGAARLAVVGLDAEYRLEKGDDIETADCLEAEFYGVFQAFRLGYFGAAFMEQYVFVDNEEIDPAWGLLGSMLCAAAFVVWMRPDGDEIVGDAKAAISDVARGNL